ncbi:MAG TPA: hypothetical protein PKC18_18570 [Lacipirellulaceae bacterium]|nr:hypothetical protein [Lacipirellulaceae bacterium]HMP06766.1 hypothetical protein [Lacipirellulaceae bacterium]
MNLRGLSPCLLAVALAAAPTPGCYDGSALLQARRTETQGAQLEEIDLGQYRISLPRAPSDIGASIVEFHIFGQTSRRDRDKVTKFAAANAPELRRRILLLVRGLSPDELDDPKLLVLRQGILTAVNEALDVKSVKRVGFYHYSFRVM